MRFFILLLVGALTLTGCSSSAGENRASESPSDDAKLSVITGSTVVASLVDDIAGEFVIIRSLVPNAVDAHTYEPLPSEVAAIADADLIILADAELNTRVTELVSQNVASGTPIVYLNEATLDSRDYLYVDFYTQKGKNPHTWTNLRYAWYWTAHLASELSQLLPDVRTDIQANSAALQEDINSLHETILQEVMSIDADKRKLVVYHDAWEYFGREYGIDIVGSLQAVDYSEPTPAQVATIISNIQDNNVQAFYGSEVFPSDVLETIARETGAIYISDLSDDALPSEVGTSSHLYVQLMDNNFQLIMQGLKL